MDIEPSQQRSHVCVYMYACIIGVTDEDKTMEYN